MMRWAFRYHRSGYGGLRLTADEFFALPNDGHRYELLDGVVIMSPSPTPRHQTVALEIAAQLYLHTRAGDRGVVLTETDVRLPPRTAGGQDIVYRPEICYLNSAKVAQIDSRIRTIPDLVVEVISPESRNYDTFTKRADYERSGVSEYWIIDPVDRAFTFLRLIGGRYVEAPYSEVEYASEVVSGFKLSLPPIRAVFTMFR
ncbi:MAG: Uma2 family endonuclease [Phycisphaerales bacterium]|nr:Uma2 family endonuclease [Phycisphaerales bacterium]